MESFHTCKVYNPVAVGFEDSEIYVLLIQIMTHVQTFIRYTAWQRHWVWFSFLHPTLQNLVLFSLKSFPTENGHDIQRANSLNSLRFNLWGYSIEWVLCKEEERKIFSHDTKKIKVETSVSTVAIVLMVALIYFRTFFKWSAIFGLNFSAWCWLPREFLLRGSSAPGQPAPRRKTKSKNRTPLS